MEQALLRENVTDRTEQRGSQLSAPKWDASLVPGKEIDLVLIYLSFT